MEHHDRVGRESDLNVIPATPAHDPDGRLAARPSCPRCGAATRLTASELATLTALRHAVDRPLQRLACELGSAHEGGHVAFTVATDDGENWWWLRWAGGLRQLVQIGMCDSTELAGPYREECLLPSRHPGPHTYDIRVVSRAAYTLTG